MYDYYILPAILGDWHLGNIEIPKFGGGGGGCNEKYRINKIMWMDTWEMEKGAHCA